MIFGTNVGVALPPPSLALVSQMLLQFAYFLAHPREDIPSGIGARCLWVSDQSNTNFSELRKPEVQLLRIPLPRTPVNRARRGRAEASHPSPSATFGQLQLVQDLLVGSQSSLDPSFSLGPSSSASWPTTL